MMMENNEDNKEADQRGDAALQPRPHRQRLHRAGTSHHSPWPATSELMPAGGDPGVLRAVVEVLTQFRRWRTDAARFPTAPIRHATISGPVGKLDLLRSALEDVKSACHVGDTGATLHIVCPEGVTRLGGDKYKQCEGWHPARRSEMREDACTPAI